MATTATTYPIPVPATSAVDATRKVNALETIAANLNAEALGILANLAKKPGASDKLIKHKIALSLV